ncbi:hypothetical protein Thiowin_01056 [Thiorhodovibrio winogradskyi]|uniref:Uncharacterized protein n=1 Tax=Thiorhodovibrio winogradskyi TaxID=77007 RepID=A0ABZ0S713_9GAMM|nr:hypothetical protein [Thiorhodovibrio winogradskyi]
MRYRMSLCCTLACALASLDAPAIETAPRISDREIIESLTRLDVGQKALEQNMNQRFAAMEETMNQRFAAMEQTMNQRFAAMEQTMDQRFAAMEENVDQRFVAMEQTMNQRFVAMEQTMNQRFAAMEISMDQRFEAMEKRFDDLLAMMLTMFSVTTLLIVSLFGYIVWDRRTALRPLEARLAQLEQDLERDLQLRHEQGSLPTRLLNVLRNLAREDERLAGVLRSFSML